MPETDIASAVASDLTNAITDYSVDSKDTDGAEAQKETTYQNTDWAQDYGYYDTIPEFKNAVDAKALWTMGAGFEADETTELLLGTIKGNGKDSTSSELQRTYKKVLASKQT